jgi:SAM-dependent methyltransferase
LTKPTLLLSNHHRDFSGGGQAVLQMLYLMQDHFDIYVDHDISAYCPNKLLDDPDFRHPKIAPLDLVPSVHLLAHYRGWEAPRGDVNIQLCFFPVEKKIDGWDLGLVVHDFVARAVRAEWQIPSVTVPPFFDHSEYAVSKKSNTCITIGNYFLEQDGHSKNQHLIIDWFKENATRLGLERLILHGFPADPNYVQSLREKIIGDSRIELFCAAPSEQVRADLSLASWLIHAIGYGRTKPEQTEHFGMVAVEALLSGAQPLVHFSGGCPEIFGVKHWADFGELSAIIESGYKVPPQTLREYGAIYAIENSKRCMEHLIRAIESITKAKRSNRQKSKLNLGCGNDYRSDYINIDIGNCRKDVSHDLEVFPYPFAANQFTEILAQHVIEHIDRRNFVQFMREMHRLLVHNGVMKVSAPYYLSKNAFTDFTHKNFMTEDSFGYFDPEHNLHKLGLVYGIDFKFRVNVELDRERTHPEVNIHYILEAIK